MKADSGRVISFGFRKAKRWNTAPLPNRMSSCCSSQISRLRFTTPEPIDARNIITYAQLDIIPKLIPTTIVENPFDSTFCSEVREWARHENESVEFPFPCNVTFAADPGVIPDATTHVTAPLLRPETHRRRPPRSTR